MASNGVFTIITNDGDRECKAFSSSKNCGHGGPCGPCGPCGPECELDTHTDDDTDDVEDPNDLAETATAVEAQYIQEGPCSTAVNTAEVKESSTGQSNTRSVSGGNNLPANYYEPKGYKVNVVRVAQPRQVPRVTASIPTNLAYTTTNISRGDQYDKLDTVIHEPSNAALVDKLTKELEDLEYRKKIDSDDVNNLTQKIEKKHEELSVHWNNYKAPMFVQELPEIDTNDLPPEIEASIKKIGLLLKGDPQAHEKKVAECKKVIAEYGRQLVDTVARLKTYDSKILSLQSKLMTEQIKYMREVQANTPKILSGEEILNNHWENALRDPEADMQ